MCGGMDAPILIECFDKDSKGQVSEIRKKGLNENEENYVFTFFFFFLFCNN